MPELVLNIKNMRKFFYALHFKYTASGSIGSKRASLASMQNPFHFGNMQKYFMQIIISFLNLFPAACAVDDEGGGRFALWSCGWPQQTIATDRHPLLDPHVPGEQITFPSCCLLPLPTVSIFHHKTCS